MSTTTHTKIPQDTSPANALTDWADGLDGAASMMTSGEAFDPEKIGAWLADCAAELRGISQKIGPIANFPDPARDVAELVQALRLCVREMDRATVFDGDTKAFDQARALLSRLQPRAEG